MEVRKSILNPYVITASAWSLVLFLYMLGWSDLYPSISIKLLSFLVLTIIVNAFWGLWLSFNGYIRYRRLNYDLKKVKRISVIYLILNILEVVYSHHIPAYTIFVTGLDSVNGNFGIPFLHPFVITLGVFLGLYTFHMMLSVGPGYIKKLFPYFLLSFLSMILIYGRGLIFLTVIGCLLIYVMSKPFTLKFLLKIAVIVISVLYVFGVLGNLRIGQEGVKITTIGQSSESFDNSGIPAEFFWSYIYISSPLANWEYNLEDKGIEQLSFNAVKNLYIQEIIPHFISNKIVTDDEQTEPNLMTDALNVCSVYTSSYLLAGWFGVGLMSIYIFVFTFVILLCVPVKSEYFVVLITILNILMIGNVFDNMMNYVLSYTIFFPIFFSLKSRIKICVRLTS